ncbi:hypothetical protein MUP59_07565 [Candidatus Bathyarchaeota archaeon]|nr:hypothetical protein [Candidatus Bathyarchaeota archaeon]
MANMSLNAYTFTWNPDRWTIPELDLSYAVVQTYESVAYFEWGLSIVGKEIILEWDWMKLAQ